LLLDLDRLLGQANDKWKIVDNVEGEEPIDSRLSVYNSIYDETKEIYEFLIHDF
jgi:hypothetical protein